MSDYDVVVVGGGAAGLSAGLVLSRARRNVAVVDAGEPRNAPAAHMHGFLSRDGQPPSEFLATGRLEAARYGADVTADTVTGIEPLAESRYEVLLADGPPLIARRVIVATGLRDEIPDIPELRERWGRDLLHCPYCHGYEVRDQPLGVLGGTPNAVEHALLIRQWSADIVYFPHTDPLADDDTERLAARNIRVVTGGVRRLAITNDRLDGVELDDGQVIGRTAVFVRPRLVPAIDLLVRLGCSTDGSGLIVADATGRTSARGVWAAGNVVNPRAQVITAAGEGSSAAIAINADLVEEDVAAAVRVARAHATA